MSIITYLLELVRRFPLRFAATAMLLVIQGLIDVASIMSLVPVIDLLIHPTLTDASRFTRQCIEGLGSFGIPVTLWGILSVFLVLNLLKSAFSILSNYSIMRTKYAVIRELMTGTYEEVFRAQWSFFANSKQGMLLNTFIREVAVVSEAFGAMAQLVAHLIQLVFYMAVPLYLSWPVTSVSLAAAAMCAWPFILLGKVSYRWGRANTATANHMSTIIQEGFSGAKVILGFGNQRTCVEALKRTFDLHREAAIKSQTLRHAIPQLYYPLGLIVLAIALIVARRLAAPLAETAVVLYALLRLIPTIGGMLGVKNSLDNFFPSYEQLLGLRRQAQESVEKTGPRRFTGFTQEITAASMTFAHPGHEPTLAGVTVRIPKGTMVALVGESGSGKSTLVDVLMGFHTPQTGGVTIDGVPLEAFDLKTYRGRIGYVPQESVLFNRTIRDNLRWADESATDDDLQRACRQANAEEFIEAFPQGYETLVGDRGVRLSGGQAQRIALARAILRKPELLILDEATSALDTASERLIQQAIERLARHTTIVVVAHRLSTIMQADYLYVLKGGRVVEEGTYTALIQGDGAFHRMAHLQALEAVEAQMPSTVGEHPGGMG